MPNMSVVIVKLKTERVFLVVQDLNIVHFALNISRDVKLGAAGREMLRHF